MADWHCALYVARRSDALSSKIIAQSDGSDFSFSVGGFVARQGAASASHVVAYCRTALTPDWTTDGDVRDPQLPFLVLARILSTRGTN